MAESRGKSEVELAINTFVDKMKEIHPDLDREGFHEAISGYVQEENLPYEDRDEEE